MKAPHSIDITPDQIERLLERIEAQNLESEDYPLLGILIRMLVWLNLELKEKKASVERLRRVFGIKTESAKKLLDFAKIQEDTEEQGENSEEQDQQNNDKAKKKNKGHGHRGAKDYLNAKIVDIAHQTLKAGDRCPECLKGSLYRLKPGSIVRIAGQPWLQVHVYAPERLRCNSCGAVFTARLPKEIASGSRADKTAKTVVALLKYRGGFPFYRQEQLQTMLGTPISDTELWEMTRDVADSLEFIHQALLSEAAKGKCLHNDDTKAKILSVMKENEKIKAKDKKARVGIFTTAILSKIEGGKQIALYFTGTQHAGENLNDVLKERPPDLKAPIQMCDALSSNKPQDHKTFEGNCLAHARRKFFEIVAFWPENILQVIVWFDEIFRNDRKAKKQSLSDKERLSWHKKYSAPLMSKIKSWCKGLQKNKQAEPNSSFGKAIAYLQNHWKEFTLFLRMKGVPLSNNADERLIKRAVLNRKNGYFFKTLEGARIGDIILSVVETCGLNGVNPLDYMVAVQSHEQDVRDKPHSWLPWNYQIRLSELQSSQEIAPAMTVSC
jgi:transposase